MKILNPTHGSGLFQVQPAERATRPTRYYSLHFLFLAFARKRLITERTRSFPCRLDLKISTHWVQRTPCVRQKVQLHQHRVEKSDCLRLISCSQSIAVGEAEAGNAGEQPARNNQLETHHQDERGRGRRVAPFHSIGRSISAAHLLDEAPDA